MSPSTVNFYTPTTFYRLPGYPLFLAGLYKLFNNDRIKALCVQIILASLAPVLMFMLSLALFPGAVRCAWCAALLATFYPGFVLYAGILATESIFLILFLLFCIAFFSSSYLLAGALLGVCSLVRPVGHYVLIVALIGMFVRFRYWNWSEKAKLFFSWLAVVLPWLLRNFLLTGYMFFHTLPGLHFLQYSAVGVVVERDHCSYFQGRDLLFAQWHKAVAEREQDFGKKLTEYEYYGLAGSLAYKTIVQYPLLTCKHAITQIARTCGTLYSSLLLYVAPGTVYDGNYSLLDKIKLYIFPNTVQPWLTWFVYGELFMALMMFIGFIRFLCVCWHTPALWLSATYLLLLSVFFIGITLSYGCARLRMQADALLIILVAYGISSLIDTKEKWR